jgi:hypothetical protein
MSYLNEKVRLPLSGATLNTNSNPSPASTSRPSCLPARPQISTRNTSRVGFPVSHSKYIHLIFLPETPPRCSAFPMAIGFSTGHWSPTCPPWRVTGHAFRFLIVNMIIRILPKSFAFSANSISNRQYSRAPTKLSISSSASHQSPITSHASQVLNTCPIRVHLCLVRVHLCIKTHRSATVAPRQEQP